MDPRWAALSHWPAEQHPPKIATPADLLAAAPAEHEDAPNAAATENVQPELDQYGYIIHPVQPTDSLLGLSFKYGVTVSELRHCNNLPTDNIFACGPTLRIPGSAPRMMATPPPDPKAAMLQRFEKRFSLSRSEARYYLEDNSWDMDKASAAVTSELAWEASNRDRVATVTATAAARTSSVTAAVAAPARRGTTVASSSDGDASSLLAPGAQRPQQQSQQPNPSVARRLLNCFFG